MSPADLNDPFGPSCCEAGGESGYESCRPCGCDPGAKWVCQRHQIEARIKEEMELESTRQSER